jgi:uncharacterized damage-inducible protein DinB
MDIKTPFRDQFVKQLDALINEVKSYENENDLWVVKQHISNSAGTLVLHLTGNLNHFIGAQLGRTGYVRQRDKEFSDRHVPASAMIAELEKARQMLITTFDSLSNEDLDRIFPVDNFGAGKKVYEVLPHLLSHFNYHLGQVNYHRRLI